MKYTYLFLAITLLSLGCKQTNEPIAPAAASKTASSSDELTIPEWVKMANIYEVNVRQYTPEGSFNAFASHLPRLKEMGVDILWFMPIYPISDTKKKGTLGSYYAVSDYTQVNPQFGSMDDFKALLAQAHDLDMYVILDWVPNHTGWDHVWLKSNPEYYTQDKNGNVIDPIDPNTGKSWGWTDVADLNFDNKEMRKAQIDDMLFWVKEVGVDGFRQDVAHGVPQDFWDEVAPALLAARSDLFLLAEAEVPSHRNNGTFHASYAWEFHHLMNAIAKGEKEISEIDNWLAADQQKYTQGFHMHFTSNHDENSWAGTVFERMGDAHKALAVLSFTLDGIPLVYSGQEEPLRKRLEFFEKDDIGFKNFEYADFYATLMSLKHNNQALWNGSGATFKKVGVSDTIYAFERKKGKDKVVCYINLGDKETVCNVEGHISGVKDIFTGENVHYHTGDQIKLGPWEYIVASSK